MTVFIAGSSGFIGSNLTEKLMLEGHTVIGADIVEPVYVRPHKFYKADLRYEHEWLDIFMQNKIDQAYCLACCMGGMGFIGDEEKHGYEIGIGSTQIVINFIEYCKKKNVKKVFYSSSACVYNQLLQNNPKVVALKESDSIPAFPDLLYGWQKLYAEKMFEVSGLDVRIARFHNVFGHYGIFDGGKEKAPAAIMRKVAKAKEGDTIEVWGTGEQTRSFLHISEALEGIERLMDSNWGQPINVGSNELVSINELATLVVLLSGKELKIKNVKGNIGVQGRNSDNTLVEEKLKWKPTKKLVDGLYLTYNWINKQING